MRLAFINKTLFVMAMALSQPVYAQEATVLKIGVAAGGGYDTVGRVMARHGAASWQATW